MTEPTTDLRASALQYALALMRNRLDVEAPTNRAVIQSYIDALSPSEPTTDLPAPETLDALVDQIAVRFAEPGFVSQLRTEIDDLVAAALASQQEEIERLTALLVKWEHDASEADRLSQNSYARAFAAQLVTEIRAALKERTEP